MKNTICLTMLAATLTIAATAAPVDRPWTHYNELLGILRMDKFYAAPLAQRDKVVMQGVIKPDDQSIAPRDVVLTIVNGTERTRIAVQPDGSFDVPFNPEWVKSNPEVLTTIPAGQKAKFHPNLMPIMPQALQFRYASLMGSVPQVNALVKSQAGVMRFLLPTLVGVTLHYPKGSHASAAIDAADGVKRVGADANGVIKLPLDKVLLAANVPVTLSEMPVSVDFLED